MGLTARERRRAEGVAAQGALEQLMTVGREKFQPLPHPVVESRRPVDVGAMTAAEWSARRHEVRLWDRTGRAQLRTLIAESVRAYADAHDEWAQRVVARQQSVADAWWQGLEKGEQSVLEGALVAAFTDNRAPLRVVEAVGTDAVLLLHLPPASVLPGRKAHVTPSGQVTTKAWTKTELNEIYAQLLAIHLLATLREAWAVGPSLRSVRVVGIGGPGAQSDIVFDVCCKRDEPRTDIDDPDGASMAQWLSGRELGLRRSGRTKQVATWPESAAPTQLNAWLTRPQTRAGAAPWSAPVLDPADPEPAYVRPAVGGLGVDGEAVTGSRAGWYPESDGRVRWWDGQRWTNHLALGAAYSTETQGVTGQRSAQQMGVAASDPRRFGLAAGLGWGGLVLVLLVGALSSGVSGAAVMVGAFVLVVALVGLVRGQVGWAHLRRVTSLAALGLALVAFTLGALTAPAQDTSATSRQTPGPPHGTQPRPVQLSHGTMAALTTPKKPSPTSTRQTPTKRHQARDTPRAARKHGPTRPNLRPVGVGDFIAAAGVVLPNRTRTPGAVNPAVSQATIGRTICVSGWTSTVRPSSSLTTSLKVAQLHRGYAYEGDTATSDYEEDHLISLELGGAPSDARNLWPQPYISPEGARVKDLVENKLHALVCSHAISLATAQHAIATNWWTAYRTYGGSSYSAASPATVHHTAAPAQPAAAPVTPGNGATARCVDGTYSYAAHHQGACSHHGGVAAFYK